MASNTGTSTEAAEGGARLPLLEYGKDPEEWNMGLINWDRELETGHPLIDGQHHGLVEAFNTLDQAVHQNQGPEVLEWALARLVRATEGHFRDEEGLMGAAAYPRRDAHRELHGNLLAQVRELLDRYRNDRTGLGQPVLDFLKGWLITHIKEEDRILVAHLHQVQAQTGAGR
jgi:hemerythrin-like metal-binding protein